MRSLTGTSVDLDVVSGDQLHLFSDSKGPPQVDVTSVSASSSSKDSEPKMGKSAKESLRRLSSSHSKDFADADSIELETISVKEGPVGAEDLLKLSTTEDE